MPDAVQAPAARAGFGRAPCPASPVLHPARVLRSAALTATPASLVQPSPQSVTRELRPSPFVRGGKPRPRKIRQLAPGQADCGSDPGSRLQPCSRRRLMLNPTRRGPSLPFHRRGNTLGVTEATCQTPRPRRRARLRSRSPFPLPPDCGARLPANLTLAGGRAATPRWTPHRK